MTLGGRFLLIRAVLLVQLLTSSIAFAQTQSPEKIKIATFNLKWFGLGGTMWNDPSQEFRQDTIGKFIKQELSDVDLIVFTEVVKPNVLQDIVKSLWSCVTYDSKWTRHQHVVLCYNSKTYRIERFDDDYIIPEANLGNSGQRPAVHAKICQLEGNCFLQVIGVHLAAGNKTEKRIKQIKIIKENLDQQTNPLPTVLLGDFNCYSKKVNGESEDDIIIFEKLLSDPNRSFRSLTKDMATYGSGEYAQSFDHIIVSDNIVATLAVAYQACQKEVDYTQNFVPYPSFRKHYSDHCYVSTELYIKEMDPK